MTTIGRNTRVNGRLEGDADVVVHGRVDGTIVLSQTLTVAPDGFVTGEVDARVIVIEGCAVGTFRASEVVHLTETAQVEGELYGACVRLDPGARLRGRIEMDLAAEPPVARTVPASRPTRTTVAEPVRAFVSRGQTQPRTEAVSRSARPQPQSTSVTRAPVAARPQPVSAAAERRAPVRAEIAEAARPSAQPAAAHVASVQAERVSSDTNGRTAPAAAQARPARESNGRASATRPSQSAVRTAPVAESRPAPAASSAPSVTIDADELTVKELREMLTERGLPLSGTKSELVRRLQTGE